MIEVRPLRAYAEVALGRQRAPVHDTGPQMVPYLRAANVKDGSLDLSDVKEMNFDPKEQEVFALKPGDVLVTEGSGSLRAVGAASVWSGEVPGVVCFQNTLLRLRPRPSTDPRFLAWWCRYAFGDGIFSSIATGANIFHISAERVRALPMTYLVPAHQRAIADYLDTETARIDALIAKKLRLRAVVADRHRALVSQAMADLPATPLKRAVTYTEGPGIMSHDFREEGIPLIRVSGVRGRTVSTDGCNFLDPAKVASRWRHFRLQRGDRVISASATMGTASIVGEEAAGAIPYTGLIFFRPRLPSTNMDYVELFLGSQLFMDQVDLLKPGRRFSTSAHRT